MFLSDFETNEAKFSKIQKYLKENYGYSLDMSSMTADKATAMVSATTQKMRLAQDPREYTRLHMIAEGLKLWTPASIQTELTAPALVKEGVDEEGVEQAKVIIAAQEIADELQDMIEDVAEMQVQDLIPLVDAMKSELSPEQADAFSASVDATLGTLLDALKSAKTGVDNAIMTAQGQTPAVDMEQPAGTIGADDVDMGDELDDVADDAFGGDDAVSNVADEPESRELKAESFDAMLSELQQKVNEAGQVSKKDLEEALAKFRSGN
jgi:hypothetical protein